MADFGGYGGPAGGYGEPNAGMAVPGAPGPLAVDGIASAGGEVRTGHPVVDTALQAMANAANLSPEDQIAQYEATHRILTETLATIDEG